MSNNEFKTVPCRTEESVFSKVPYKTNKNNSQKFSEVKFKNLERRINSPKVDLVERDSFYLVRIELPGVIPESIKIQIKEHRIVLVSGSKLQDTINETDRVIYRECKYDNFIRRIKLPGPIKFFNVNEKLHFTNGVLNLIFEKATETDLHQQATNETNTQPKLSLNLNENVNWSEL